ncbi:MAG TPA: DUF4292 domain-containing protein [Acidobacteriaceae bacterium]|nr:DUF4292 domain-containing protein [Acidobacteriaceae bacterium]
MHRIGTRWSLVLLLALPALNGCLWHTRRVPQARMPAIVMTATPQQLVDIINKHYDAVNSLSAAVTFTATSGGVLNGKEKTITPFSGYILLRKPEALRVIGYLPVVHSPAFDMASTGNAFKLLVPPRSEAIEGPNALTQPSQNAIENLRPFMFFDAMVIPQIGPDEVLSVTADTNNLVVNPKTKKLEIRPEYLLTVQERQPNTRFTQVHRVIHISRIDLRPVQQDIYDQHGQVQTQAFYGPLQTFGTERFPGTITIKWPQQQEQILITIEKLRMNLPLANDQFELKIPEGTKIKELH